MNHVQDAAILAAAALVAIAVAAGLAMAGMRMMASDRFHVRTFGVPAIVAATALLSTASIAAWGAAIHVGLAVR